MHKPNHHGGQERTPDFDDVTPIEIPINARLPEPLEVRLSRFLKAQIEAEKNVELESPEEADDFEDVDPDLLDFSAYELPLVQDEHEIDPGYNPDPPQALQEAPQEEIVTPEVPKPPSQEETPSGASE